MILWLLLVLLQGLLGSFLHVVNTLIMGGFLLLLLLGKESLEFTPHILLLSDRSIRLEGFLRFLISLIVLYFKDFARVFETAP